MANTKVKSNNLTLEYTGDDGSYHCICVCGTKLIVSEEQLSRMSSCGCIERNILMARLNLSSEAMDMDKFNLPQQTMPPQNEARGVNFEASKNKWRARIKYRTKEYHLGYFTEKEDALKRKQEAENNLQGDFIGWYNKTYQKG